MVILVTTEALLRAYRDGMDVINLSLGGPDGFSQAPAAVVASRIAQNGTIVVASGVCKLQRNKQAGFIPSLAGNSGKSGAWLPSSPAVGKGVIAVGSVDKLATEPPSWNPSDLRLGSTVITIQNATIYINGQEGAPVVSP